MPIFDNNQPGTMKESIRNRLPRAEGNGYRVDDSSASGPPPRRFVSYASEPGRWGCLPTLWTVASILSLIVNVVLFAILVVALLLFTLGGVFAMYEGVHKLAGDPAEQASPVVSLVVLVVSLVIELSSFTVAARAFNRARGSRSIREALAELPCPYHRARSYRWARLNQDDIVEIEGTFYAPVKTGEELIESRSRRLMRWVR